MYKYTFGIFFLLSVLTTNCHSQNIVTSPGDEHIQYEGRIAFKDDAAELTWPATTVTIRFEGTGISGVFKDQDTSNYYNVIIDHDSIYKIHFDTEKRTYALAANLPQGKHSLQLFKRTEWDKGKPGFMVFQ